MARERVKAFAVFLDARLSRKHWRENRHGDKGIAFPYRSRQANIRERFTVVMESEGCEEVWQ